MKIKKLFALMLAALILVCLSGCKSTGNRKDGLLLPPKLEGDMAPVQEALETYVPGDITLKYPTSGEYRSAFILKDLDGDTRREAVALYSTTADNTVSMHINVIASSGESWEVKGDLSLVANGVESVSFADMDGDKTLEIIVGWTVYGSAQKQVGIYDYDEGLKLRAVEPYTNFLCADISGDGVEDLTAFHLNLSSKTATARVFSLTSTGIAEIGKAELDGGVSSYSAPVLSTLADGTPAIYLDGVKGTGMLTEIVWLSDGKLSGIYNPETPEVSLTYRASAVSSRDFDGDGIIDIPLSELLKSTETFSDTDKVYFTNWSEFDRSGFITTASTFMNYSDGYILTVPDKWKDSLLLIRKTEARMRFFYSYDPETDIAGEELFRLVAVTASDIDGGVYSNDEFIEIARSGNLVYLTKITTDNVLGITEKDIRQMFSIIK